ncbi:hypothetical protein IC757_11165 [Wenzhouxiangella sp. AB-CW3]|uniref:hypothetical protein n=1 Tax=Wenzhouxiangella sp. AB-CW3 TaxID=2771012 RepID=UPI00168B0E2B|nr:hypothetical protein [Wenzhouxiangella sp. AB-CW3]QOC21599.1 hypothetical protein IC757_11165 [Wenzhouxiangella sp. AB-CW3]
MVRTLPFIVVLLALLITGTWLLTTPTPPMIGGGLMLAAAAPFVFMISSLNAPADAARRHPVMISVLCGFGAVVTMFGVHRFGDQHQWVLWLALLALCLWMVWQRYVWRRPPPS